MLIFWTFRWTFESPSLSKSHKTKTEKHTRELEKEEMLNSFWNGWKAELPGLRLWAQSCPGASPAEPGLPELLPELLPAWGWTERHQGRAERSPRQKHPPGAGRCWEEPKVPGRCWEEPKAGASPRSWEEPRVPGRCWEEPKPQENAWKEDLRPHSPQGSPVSAPSRTRPCPSSEPWAVPVPVPAECLALPRRGLSSALCPEEPCQGCTDSTSLEGTVTVQELQESTKHPKKPHSFQSLGLCLQNSIWLTRNGQNPVRS